MLSTFSDHHFFLAGRLYKVAEDSSCLVLLPATFKLLDCDNGMEVLLGSPRWSAGNHGDMLGIGMHIAK